MTEIDTFAARIREYYPEGLTGIFAIGGTRTTYILSRNRQSSDPGKIQDFEDYAQFLIERYQVLMTMFFELGGQHMIIPVLGLDRFTEFSSQYIEMISNQTLILIGESFTRYYRENAIDPYFVGIDTLMQLPQNQAAYRLGAALDAFQRSWPQQEGHHKVVWEIAPIPLYSIWRSKLSMSHAEQAALEAELATTHDIEALQRLTYKFYARAAYGTDMPLPNFYVGSNRKGQLKLRSILPQTLLSGQNFRLYYLPYPSLFMKSKTLQAILDDLAFGHQRNKKKNDYAGQYTPDLIEQIYQRVLDLSDDPTSTLGFDKPLIDDI